MAFMFSGVSAQILTDYDETNATDMYQTEGTTFRLYVEPDIIYSSSWDAATNNNLGADARWTWTFSGLTGSVTSGDPVNQNYVEFTNPTTGTYTVEVVESNVAISCSGATQTQTINVVDAPTGGFTTADVTDFCGDQSAETITIRFVENVPDALTAYAFAVREVVEEIDGSGNPITTVSSTDTYVDFPTNGKANGSTPGVTLATPNFDYEFNTSALDVSNGNRTRYTYTLLEASDAGTGTNGIISAISQKSDYIDGLTTHAFSDDQVVFIVNPAPTTGPIYHIPNDFNL